MLFAALVIKNNNNKTNYKNKDFIKGIVLNLTKFSLFTNAHEVSNL